MIDDDTIDRSEWVNWTDKDPMVKKERVAKGDLVAGEECKDCDGTGKNSERQICASCYGKGRVGEVNATEVPLSDIQFAQAQVRNILNFLWEIDAITAEQQHAGAVYQAWRDQHRVALGLDKAIGYDDPEAMSVKLRAYGFVLILKKLSSHDQKTIESCISTFLNSHTEYFARREQRIYRQSLHRLSQILPEIRERIAYLEGLSDAQRDMLAEESLKNFIAELPKFV